MTLTVIKTTLFALLILSIAVPATLMASAVESMPLKEDLMIPDKIKSEKLGAVPLSEIIISLPSLKVQLEETRIVVKLSCPDSEQFLILKKSGKSPACVNFESKEKLIERGWGISIPKGQLSDVEQFKIFMKTR